MSPCRPLPSPRSGPTHPSAPPSTWTACCPFWQVRCSQQIRCAGWISAWSSSAAAARLFGFLRSSFSTASSWIPARCPRGSSRAGHQEPRYRMEKRPSRYYPATRIREVAWGGSAASPAASSQTRCSSDSCDGRKWAVRWNVSARWAFPVTAVLLLRTECPSARRRWSSSQCRGCRGPPGCLLRSPLDFLRCPTAAWTPAGQFWAGAWAPSSRCRAVCAADGSGTGTAWPVCIAARRRKTRSWEGPGTARTPWHNSAESAFGWSWAVWSARTG